MRLVRISAVSYLNTLPFIYGIEKSGLLRNYALELDVPAICAEKFERGQVDIALVPVGALPDFSDYRIIGDYGIGASGKVGSVALHSSVPLEKIKTLSLDKESRTSIELTKILVCEHWKLDLEYVDESEHADAVLKIGDKSMKRTEGYPYFYDLVEAWTAYSGLPFIFAVWLARPNVPESLLVSFVDALKYGLDHIDDAVKSYSEEQKLNIPPVDYLRNYIRFSFDDKSREGLNLFLSLIEKKQ